LWLLPSLVGLGQSATVFIGAVMCLAFLVAILFLVGRLSWLETLLYGLALGSPAVLLAVERGNIDLIIFVLCVGGLLAVNRGGPSPTAAGVALILLATLLKLYPVFVLAALIPRTRLAVGALLLAAIYALLTLPDLALISQGTPRSVLFAYGSEPVGSLMGVAPWLVDVGVVLEAALVATLKPVRGLARTSSASLESAAFVAGSVIYMGTFLIGSNWVYRLLFLVLTMPQLLAWLRSTGTRSSAIYVLAAILAILWLAAASMVPGLGNDAFQALSVIVFVVLGGLTACILWTQTVAMHPQLTARIPQLKLSRV
jgi:hypothetical protein